MPGPCGGFRKGELAITGAFGDGEGTGGVGFVVALDRDVLRSPPVCSVLACCRAFAKALMLLKRA